MLKLSRMGIRSLAANDFVYSRGINYYKNHHVVNASYSNKSKQYRIVVKGNNNYMVTIGEKEDGSFDYSCNCPGSLKEEGACKHVIAALTFLMKYQEQNQKKEPMTEEEKNANQILDYFEQQEDIVTNGEIFHLEVTIVVPGIYHEYDKSAYLCLHAGSSKKYKIQSIKKFLLDYSNGENITLGKDFKFVAGESEFDRNSQSILNYLIQILDLHDMLEQENSKNIFMKSQMMLSSKMLVSIFRLLGQNPFNLKLMNKGYGKIRYKKGNPKIHYELAVEEDDGISLDCREGENIIPIMDSGKLLYYRGFVYEPDDLFILNYLPFYKSLGKRKKPLVFQGEQKERFLEYVLPKINHTLYINVPEELKEIYIYEDLKPSLYMDKYNNDIKAELRFRYGEHEFNAFESGSSDGYIVVRQKEKEEEIIHYLENMDFECHKNYFLMNNDAKIYEFLTSGIKELEEICTLFYSADFKKIGVKNSGSFKTNLRLSSDLNLLEFDIENSLVPKEELNELFRNFRLKKKYYRLRSGDFIDLEDENIVAMANILDKLNVTVKDLKEETLTLAKNKALYLNEALKDTNIQTEKSRDFEALIEGILSPDAIEYEVPASIDATLRPYQKVGYQWLRTLAEHGLGGILADDMGLGKTLQSIVYISAELQQNPGEHFLIVCPTSLVYNWKEELEKFAPFIRSSIVTGAPKDRQATIEKYEQVDVLITSYPLIRRDIELYETIRFHTVFIDEAQYIKNAGSLSAQSVKRLVTKNRFALTGTPIENSLSELWSIFDFLMPMYLLTHSKFVNQYEKPILKNDQTALQDLGKHIHPFILRRMKKEVLTELPDKIETKILVDMTEEQRKVYNAFIENIRGELGFDGEVVSMEQSKIKILAALTRLRQICCHPSTFLEQYEGGSGKLDLLMDIVPEAIANEHRILIFSQFTSMLQIIAKRLKKEKIEFFYLEGSTPGDVRSDYVKRFNAGEGSVFLISLKAGGTGLNLVGADTVIHYDPWWNPAVEDQATDRAYRIGQKNSVQVIRLITKGTIEEKINKLQMRKKDLSDSVIQTKELFINMLSREELEELFTI